MTNAVMNVHTTPGAIIHDYSDRAPAGMDRAKILKFGKNKALDKEQHLQLLWRKSSFISRIHARLELTMCSRTSCLYVCN